MAENGASQLDVASLKETLCAQQKLLQNLYNELDVEREAAASAASEALSMILRLQGEKATVQMEAEQYKRLAEEKMCHAEEALAIFEDLMFQKEMEIASLDYQVQAYKYKLLSMGCTDPGGNEIKFPEHLLQLNESVKGDGNLSRRNSAPLLFPLKFRKNANGRESSPSPDIDFPSKSLDEHTSHEMNEHSSDMEKKTESSAAGAGSINSYWEQIRKLDERVKVIAGTSYANLRRETRSPSPFSRMGSSCDLARLGAGGDHLHQINLNKHPGSTSENENNTDFSSSPNVLDVFEVPQADKDTADIPMPAKNVGKFSLQDCDRPEIPHSFAIHLPEKEKRELLKRLLTSPQQENHLQRLSEGSAVSVNLATVQPTTSVADSEAASINLGTVQPTTSAADSEAASINLATIQPTTSVADSEAASINLATVQPTTSVADSETKVLQPDRPSEIIEAERQVACPDREEVLKLLYEIKDQLNLLHTDVTALKAKESSSSQVVDEVSLVSLKEVMLEFWL